MLAVLLFVCVVYSRRRFVLCLTLCYFVLVFFSPSSIAITSLGEERANLKCFSYVCSICACLVLSVSSPSWCLGRAAVCDYGTAWIFLLPSFIITAVKVTKIWYSRKGCGLYLWHSLDFSLPFILKKL